MIQIDEWIQLHIRRFFFFGFNGKFSIVLLQQHGQRRVSFLNRLYAQQPEFDDQAILECLPKPFYTALSLRGNGLDMFYVKLSHCLSEVGERLRFASQLLLHSQLLLR